MMSSRLLVAVVAGVSGSPDHSNLMQATRFVSNEKVSVDSDGEVTDNLEAMIGSVPTEECDACIADCETYYDLGLGNTENIRAAKKKCRTKCRKQGKCYTDCIPPTQAD